MTRSTPPSIGRRRLIVTTAALAVPGAALVVPGAARAQQPPAAPAAAPPAGGQGAGQGAAQGAGQSAAIDVSHARTAPIPIAIPDFAGGGDGSLGQQIAGVITDDLRNCGLFRPLDPASFIQHGLQSGEIPNWQNWSVIGAQALVSGSVDNADAGQVRVSFELWDVLPQQRIQGTAYTTAASNWRRIAHIISDVIYERLLGEKGYFDTRIVYVSDTGPRDRRTRRLAIMDQDGANTRYLTDGRWMALTPRFNPTRDQIAYMSYADNRPRVYLMDLASGRQQVLGDFGEMTFAPRFSPDGGSVIMAVSRGGGSDIVVVDLASRSQRRLTSSGAIDVSPCYSPDGTQIVFNSDRGGDQQLYIMAADGSGARRISFGQGRYATPVWSPRGDLIAFTRLGSDTFGIGVMKPDGSGERILSESFDVEGPTFCPNGRVLMFWRSTASRDARGAGYSSRLVSIDITGFNERPVPTPTDASDPAWSPLLS